ncbi:thioredoxin domain-containing protein [Natranaerofaba carboxydovora]|uniref:thioredoxin domain-containing protein n=1 Tax=Natranaerofaba carboxydovora TaxID=2742683 RepID=UPI001F13C949|nr:thioredoxin domain-containing protein [Natranaerofaba carboxydovora]UMZ73174.1 hypothetical protein ACONDI_00727 [Natranaerofaba carboxydovora]
MNKPNELINEKSPYLLQHAHNPVDWFPWGEEAFDKAKKENKPVFLSIGYSTCRWCHNMKRESFEDEEIASILNENFVSVKVDREELPHVDTVYMSVCEALTGQGGWPLTVFLTPDKIPFFAGTYFPKESVRGHIGLKDLLQKVTEKWQTDKEDLIDKGKEITEALSPHLNEVKEGLIDEKAIEKGYQELEKRFDEKYGGFSKSPKFPMPATLMFLLRYNVKFDNEDINCDVMIHRTLGGMYRGGLFDHLGGGFYRYSVDNKWLVPHFEKMLYDNVMLTLGYLEAYQWSKKELYKEVADTTLQFIEREMLSDEGTFYTAIDAESEGEEGKFYLWSYDEIIDILGDKEGKEFNEVYGVTKKGNFEGKNILNRLEENKTENTDNIKSNLKNDLDNEAQIRRKYQRAINKLFEKRKERIPPETDDKILTSLNSLAVVCFSRAARVFDDSRYLSISRTALHFILKNLRRQKDGRVLARYRDGEAAFLGNLEDYAYLSWGLLEFYQASFEKKYLNIALDIVMQAENLFRDDEKQAFYKYGNDAGELFARPIEIFDGSTPSGNSVMLYVYLKLSNLIEAREKKENLEQKAENLIKACAGSVNESPAFSAFFLTGAMMFLKPPLKVNIHDGSGKSEVVWSFVNEVDSYFIPDVLINLSDFDEDEKNKDKDKEKEKVTAEVCDHISCKGKVDKPEELEKILFTR